MANLQIDHRAIGTLAAGIRAGSLISSDGKDFQPAVEIGCAVYGLGIGFENEKVEEVAVNRTNCLEAVQ